MKRPPKTWRRHVDAKFVRTRLQALVTYLTDLLGQKRVWQLPATQAFAEISSLSLSHRLGRKGKEGWLSKRSGGNTHLGNDWFQTWRKRWFVAKDNCIVYFQRRTDTTPRGVMLIDDAFTIKPRAARYFELSNRTRSLLVATRSYRHTCEWIDELRRFYGGAPRSSPNPHASFAPPRPGSSATWLVDGQAAMASMARAIMDAKQEVFISGWWISPDVQLVRKRAWQSNSTQLRCDSDGDSDVDADADADGDGAGIHVALTLSELLLRKANEGVKVRV